MNTPFNPLDKINLGKSVAEALLDTAPIPIAGIESFNGAGIYAIYYTGDFPAYAPIVKLNKGGEFKLPIYVGSAVPPGGRKGGLGLSDSAHSKLFGRLSKHRQSLQAARNLDIEDFHCRYLLVDDIWIPLGESLMIATFAPLWNQRLDGFGNHDPGSGRYQQLRSPWDTVHPGREWAEKCKQRAETPEQLIADIESYLRTANLP
jgi:hypothetical protein